jgi:hypothetical protein
MIDHDRLFKELLTTFFVEFLELFFPELLHSIDTNKIEFLDKELVTDVIGGATYEADIVAKVAFKQQPAFFIVHIEHQAQPEQDFKRRMFWYFALMHLKYGVPIYPIAIFSDKSSQREEPDTYSIAFPDIEVLKFQFRVIQLRRLSWRDFATRLNPVASALLPKMGMERSERPQVLLASLRLLAKLGLDAARQRFLSGFINTYMRLTKQEEAQFQAELAQLSPEEQEGPMELTTTWKEEGLREEALILTRRLLTRRVGLLTPDVEERIEALSLIQLEALAEALLDFTSSGDLHTWLDNNPPE